jgi:NAD(P)-dependent dehydrogenase (short-subunit alcohol dehydrogenase family)
MTPWTAANIPDQTGKIAVVTGATSGIGLVAADELAAHGAEVIMAVRDTARGEALAANIIGKHPGADIRVSALDLASLASIRAFAARAEALPRIDILLNNAGLGMQPLRDTTVDGFERQFGTNHLGHFALTGLLLPVLLRAPAPRVVTIASIAHNRGKMNWDDVQYVTGYTGRAAYGQSKLANLMFAQELAARATAAGSKLVSIGAHPGVSSTGFVKATKIPGFQQKIGEFAISLLGQTAEKGALPGLYAATMPDALNGQYWGPDGFMEVRGNPRLARVAPHAANRADWQRLWTASEALTGVQYVL